MLVLLTQQGLACMSKEAAWCFFAAATMLDSAYPLLKCSFVVLEF
jgi:hypothetical protein